MRFLISAGPTREFLDPVRYLSNPSSGRMGIALAKAARRLGHEVVLVHGPCSVPVPQGKGLQSIGVTTCLEMRKAILKAAARADIIVMAAAVTDFRAKNPRPHKVKKSEPDACVLRLVRNPDILAELGSRKRRGQILIGFSAETKELRRHALEKLRKKNLDCIVANKVGGSKSAFESPDNEVLVLRRNQKPLSFSRMDKSGLALRLTRLFLKLPPR